MLLAHLYYMSTFLTCQVKRTSVEAGLPNITGKIENIAGYSGLQAYGLIIMDASNFTQNIVNGGANVGGINLNIDASRNSAIYGASSTVTPLSLSCMIIVKY